MVHSIPALVKKKLTDLLKGQYSFGAAMHGIQPLEWKQGKHNITSHIFSDDHLWMLLSVPAYLKETGDMAFLKVKVPFADKGQATVYDHLKKALDFSWSKRGPRGFMLGLTADWNDCLNLRGKGESMFSTFLFLHGLNEFVALAKRLKKSADAKKYTKIRATLMKAVDKRAWDGDWFLRGYLDSGKKLGGKKSDQSKIFINSQTWAVIAGAGERPKLERAMDSLKEHLATEHGIVINHPAYTEHDPEVGAVTCFPGGLKENGGIFCHANTWTVVAEGLLGRGDRAFELYRSFLPAAKNDSHNLYTMSPTCISQFITGKEHPISGARATRGSPAPLRGASFPSRNTSSGFAPTTRGSSSLPRFHRAGTATKSPASIAVRRTRSKSRTRNMSHRASPVLHGRRQEGGGQSIPIAKAGRTVSSTRCSAARGLPWISSASRAASLPAGSRSKTRVAPAEEAPRETSVQRDAHRKS